MAEQEQTLPGAEGGDEEKKKQEPTLYRILFGRVPEPDSETPIAYREILNRKRPEDGFYEATSPETARRRAFNDEEAEAHPHIQAALKAHGVVLRHVPAQSWGEAEREALRVETREDLVGKV